MRSLHTKNAWPLLNYMPVISSSKLERMFFYKSKGNPLRKSFHESSPKVIFFYVKRNSSFEQIKPTLPIARLYGQQGEQGEQCFSPLRQLSHSNVVSLHLLGKLKHQ